MDQFLLGMIFAHLARFHSQIFQSRRSLIAVILAWMILYHLFNRLGGYSNLEAKWLWVIIPTAEGVFYAAITAYWLHVPISLPKWLDEGLAWLGKLSFSFYLNHILINQTCFVVAQNMGFAPTSFLTGLLFLSVVVLPVLVAFSALTFYLIEESFLTMRRAYVQTPPGAQPVTTEHRRAA